MAKQKSSQTKSQPGSRQDLIRSAETGQFVDKLSWGKGSSRRNQVISGRGKVEVKKIRTVITVLADSDRPEFSWSPLEKMDLIENGISKKALENLKNKANLDYDQLAKVLKVARATLISKKGREKFNSDVSDKIFGLADIYSYGYEVFEDRDNFNQWIFSQNRALGNQAPFDILHNSFGREEVKNLIGRIDYGIYS